MRRQRLVVRAAKIHNAIWCKEHASNILSQTGWISMLRFTCRLHSTWVRSAISAYTPNLPRENYASSAAASEPKEPAHRVHSRNPLSKEDLESARNHSDKVVRLTQKLLSKPNSMEIFKTSLENQRNNETLQKTLGLSKSDAETMFILCPDLLSDVHMAISYFSNSRNLRGIALDHPSDGTTIAKHKKIPGPILCARLLELIGVPNYYSELAAKSSASPILVVHSAQIDQLLHCCLQTTLALSNSCKPGKGSLIGYDFNFQKTSNDHANLHDGEKKTAGHLAEEIFRAVWNMQIRFTFETRTKGNGPGPIMHMPNMLTRISAMNNGFILEYLNEDDSSSPNTSVFWSNKDQRRYKQSVSLFNAVLAAYSRLGSSATGTQQEVRRNIVQAAERLLLELAVKNNTLELSPSTVLQSTRPDVISFNTAMNAWSQLSPKLKNGIHTDEYAKTLSTLTAERTQAILEMMQELWDEDRSNRSTRQTLQAAWEEYGDGEFYQSHAIAPNTSSYNTVLNAWSRSSNSNAIYNAISVFRAMVERCNLMCNGRVSLMRQNSNLQHVGKVSLEGDHSFPDSRTFVALLGSCSCNSLPMNFSEAVTLIESIFDTMKYWDEQLQWSRSQGISPHGLLIQVANNMNSILNAYSYNALIRAFSAIPKSSWEESLHCCNRIEEVIWQDMSVRTAPDAITRGIAIDSWIKCAEFAKNDAQKMELCVEKACAHADLLLPPESMLGDESGDGSRVVHAVNDVIALCGKCSMLVKANELYLRAKKCKINNFATVSTVIEVLSQSKDISDVDKALNHLLDFEKDVMRKSSALVRSLNHDNTRMYNACIVGFINADQSDVGYRRAHDLLLHMINNHFRDPLHLACPNTSSFAYVMDALAQKGLSGQVEALLSKMEELNQRRKIVSTSSQRRDLVATIEPNIVLYNTLMTSYVRSNDIGSLQSAENLMQRMEDSPNIPSPDAITRSLLLKLRSHHHSGSGKQAKHSAKRGSETSTHHNIGDCKLDDLILDTINQTHKPHAKLFNSMMKAHANSGTQEGAEKCDALLSKIEEMYTAGDIQIRPDIILHNMVMNAWQSFDPNKAEEVLNRLCVCHEKGDKDLSPNDASFSICIHAWCKSTEPDAAEQAERILRRKEAFLNRVDGLVIRTTDYNSIISKWRRDPENGSERAALLFEEMLQKASKSEVYQSPTDVTLNALLAVYAKSNDDKAAQNAEDHLRRMNQLYEDKKSNILPDVISYRTCIDAWIRRKSTVSPEKVEALVKDMTDKYKHEGRDDLCPDSNVFDLILKACNLAPSTWNIEAADRRHDHTIAIANRTFTLLRGNNEFNAKPTHSTYAFMFRIFNRHMDFTDP
ncbi:hypothetical protein HJC23_009037, partial [Cyclotella cryptica]